MKVIVNSSLKYYVGKFMGSCNYQKSQIDLCFKLEKEAKVKRNSSKSHPMQRSYNDPFVKHMEQKRLAEQGATSDK